MSYDHKPLTREEKDAIKQELLAEAAERQRRHEAIEQGRRSGPSARQARSIHNTRAVPLSGDDTMSASERQAAQILRGEE